MTNINDTDFVDIEVLDFHTLIRPFSTLPYTKTLPIVQESYNNPDSPNLFGMMIHLFLEYLPEAKHEEFQNYSIEQAMEIITDWMNKK
jgi:hypothetical protein